MATQLFKPGDVVKMKSKEEVLEIIFHYWPGKREENNSEYINQVTKLCDGIYTVEDVENLNMFQNLQDTVGVFLEEEETHLGWRLLQNYFVLYKEEVDHNIPDLFG